MSDQAMAESPKKRRITAQPSVFQEMQRQLLVVGNKVKAMKRKRERFNAAIRGGRNRG